jgi:hypothetical protein
MPARAMAGLLALELARTGDGLADYPRIAGLRARPLSFCSGDPQ